MGPEAAVVLSESDGVAVITFNRPDNRNSMTPELLRDFAACSETVRRDQDLRAVVIAGRGSCFSAGADFKSNLQVESETGALDHERSYAMYEPFLSVLDIRVPVIAALNGHAVGGGFGLALACDIRIANRDAKYGANFTKLGLAPGMAISYLLPRLLGLAKASELLYTGRLIDGVEAERIGLVNAACVAEDVVPRALQMAREIADNAPVAIRLTKETMRRHMGWDVRGGAYAESFAQAETVKMDDAREGMAALLEKRKPIFSGR